MEHSIIEAVLPSFIIAIVGYIYSIKDSKLDLKSVANLIYYVFSPCMVYSSLAERKFQIQEFAMLGTSVIILIFSLMFVTMIYMKMTRLKKNGIYLPIIFMNTGNIALPMALFLYGNDGLSKAIIFHLVNVMFLYTMGVFMVSKKTDLKEFFKIPFVYAGIAGVLVGSTSITVPDSALNYLQLLGKAIDILGKGAIPLLIISLGYSLKKTRIADIKHGLAGAGMRVILGPAIAFGLVALYRYIGWAPTEVAYDTVLFKDLRVTEAIIVLMGAMPAPITSFLLNEKFDDCPEIAASMVLVGSLAGIVTIPAVLAISKQYILG